MRAYSRSGCSEKRRECVANARGLIVATDASPGGSALSVRESSRPRHAPPHGLASVATRRSVARGVTSLRPSVSFGIKMSDPYEQIIDALASKRRVLVTTHVRPDGDALGSSAAVVLGMKQKGVD